MKLDQNTIVGVIGAGAMGAGIAQVAAVAGHVVYLNDISEDAINHGIKGIEKRVLRLVEKGRLTQKDADLAISNLKPAVSLEALAPVNLIVEAAVENLNIKREIFAKLEDICSDDTVLSSNTSSLSINSIASGMQRPQNIVGLHFFNPAPIMKLVEIVSGLETDEKMAKDLFDLASDWGKTCVHAKSTPGFIVNRVARSFYGEALALLNENATSVANIDHLIKDGGKFRMGPLELTDLIGHDVNYAVSCSVFDAYYGDQRFKPSLVQKALVDANMLGRKTKKGFYNYQDGAEGEKPAFAEKQSGPSAFKAYNSKSFNHNIFDLVKQSSAKMELIEHKDKRGLELSSGVRLLFTRGKLAAEEEKIENAPVVLIDYASDFLTCQSICLAPSDNCTNKQVNEVIGFFQDLNKNVVVIGDVAGMVVMRTIASLVNEAADAVNQNVANAKDVDLAMENGVNYPKGPLKWADEIGVSYICDVLQNMESIYSEGRYRQSPLLYKKSILGASFHE